MPDALLLATYIYYVAGKPFYGWLISLLAGLAWL